MTPTYPLLSPKPIREFTALEYKTYISSLHIVPEAKVDISAKLTAKGSFSLTSRRKPKYITRAEIEKFSEQTKTPINEVWLYAKSKNYLIVGSRKELTDDKT